MVSFPVPDEVLLALVLLPGYVVVRVGLYFARYAGPADWPEYEKTALSLVGSTVLLAGVGVVFPRVVAVTGRDGDVFVATDVGLGGYVASLAVAVAIGALLGQVMVTLYGRLYGLKRLRADPREYLLQRLEPPVPVRIVADGREVVGRVQYTDEEGTPVVLHGPRLATTRDGKEYRERMGTYAYVDPGTVEWVYFGAAFKPEEERSGFLARVLRFSSSMLGEGVEPPSAEEWSGPTVTVSEDPLLKETGCVRARGTVRNDLSRDIVFLQVRIEFEDADGSILATGTDSFERLGGGDTWRFDVTYETDEPESVASFSVGRYASPFI